jgi:hypothetical protein
MLKTVIGSIKKAGLDRPWPLKYTNKKVKATHVFPFNIMLPDYETDSIWMHLGLCYLDIVRMYDQKLFKRYIDKYSALIEKNRNFLELFNPDGSVFIKRLYVADESMLWAAKYLELIS